jgi:hypothetical protein
MHEYLPCSFTCQEMYGIWKSNAFMKKVLKSQEGHRKDFSGCAQFSFFQQGIRD